MRKGGSVPAFATLDKTNWSRFDAAARPELQTRLKAIFNGDKSDSWHFNPTSDFQTGAWEQDEQGRLELNMPLRIMLSPSSGGAPNVLEGIITVQTKSALDPVQYGGRDDVVIPDWEVKRLQLLRSHYMKKQG